MGDSVKLAYMEQSRDSLKDDDNVWQAISDGQEIIKLGAVQVNSRAWVSRFGFTGTDQQKKLAACPAASAIAFILPACSSKAQRDPAG